MKKVAYLFWGFFLLNTVFLQAQVRIGGLKEPHPSALLDLNESNNANDGKRGLALSRVSLASSTTQLNGSNPPDGMIVYNTDKTFGEGIYYWASNKWIKIANGSFIDGDTIVGNEVVGPTVGGALEKNGLGTTKDPYTLDIKQEGVKTYMIENGAVTAEKINKMNAKKDDILFYDGGAWKPQPIDSIVGGSGTGSGVKVQFKSETRPDHKKEYKVKFNRVKNLNKTMFILNGHYGTDRIQMHIISLTDTTAAIPANSKVGGYSLQVVEFQ
ncbi:MAG: hypothetical protein LBT25_08830 [Candidatus Symbiothrix sp.]|jgi:hypothetical protein|nr:hypothetical protein [Candidatus Symbiothrix sp.]